MDDLDDVLARARSAYGPDPEAKTRIRGALTAAVGGAALAGAGTAKAAAVQATATKGAATLGTNAAASGLETTVGATAKLVGAAKAGVAAKLGTAAASFGTAMKLGVALSVAGGSLLAYGALESRSTAPTAPATDSGAATAPSVEARAATPSLPEIAVPAPTPDVTMQTDPIVPAPRGTNLVPPKKEIEPALPAPRSTLKDELSLIRRATEELRSGQPREAIATLAVHRNRFPNSAMATEREGLGLLARCSLGRTAETRAAAERFARDTGSSPLAAHVRTQCLK